MMLWPIAWEPLPAPSAARGHEAMLSCELVPIICEQGLTKAKRAPSRPSGSASEAIPPCPKRNRLAELDATAGRYVTKALCTEQQKERDRIENNLTIFLKEYHNCPFAAATPTMLGQYLFQHHSHGRTSSGDGAIHDQAKASTLWGILSHLKMLYDSRKTQNLWSEDTKAGNPARSPHLEAVLRGYANEQIEHGITTSHAVPLTDEDMLLLTSLLDEQLADPRLTFPKRIRLLQLDAWLLVGYWASDRSADVLRLRWEDIQVTTTVGAAKRLLIHHQYTKPERGAARPASGKEEARVYAVESPPCAALQRLDAHNSVQRLLRCITHPAIGSLATGWVFADKQERGAGGGTAESARWGGRMLPKIPLGNDAG